ncbi:MAG: DegT/DnrJ/EryC1/StrS family aminotransferase, partial [Mycobacterium sp.]
MTTNTADAARISQVVPWIGDDERTLVDGVLEDNWLTEGPRSREFARQLMELTGAPYGVFAPNGTLALALGLLALGIRAGDEVL